MLFHPYSNSEFDTWIALNVVCGSLNRFGMLNTLRKLGEMLKENSNWFDKCSKVARIPAKRPEPVMSHGQTGW